VPLNASARKLAEDFSKTYMEFYPLIYSSVLTRVGNRHDADDICQEIFIIMYDKFYAIENKRNWLYGTMKNVLYSHYRKNNRNTASVEDVDDLGIAFTNGARDTRILIGEAIEKIECTEEERIILEMVATFNFSYSRVGEILGWSRRQVEYCYSQMVKRIQDYLSSRGIKDIAELL
jgi:RNA polymerase sigma factor (sigma-70 family)